MSAAAQTQDDASLSLITDIMYTTLAMLWENCRYRDACIWPVDVKLLCFLMWTINKSNLIYYMEFVLLS